MTLPGLFVLSLLLSPALADFDAETRRPNIVTKFLDEILDSLFEKLSTKNASINLIDLGEFGNFSRVEGCVLGLNKSLDGIKSHGFKMNINATSAIVGGKYHIVNLDLPGLFPVFGKGDFSVSMGLYLKVTLNAVRDFQTEKFNITLPELGIQVENPKVRFENLMYDPHVSDFLNELISNLVPSVATMIVEEGKGILEILVSYYGNGVFDCLKEITKEKRMKCIRDLFVTYREELYEKLVIDLIRTLKARM